MAGLAVSDGKEAAASGAGTLHEIKPEDIQAASYDADLKRLVLSMPKDLARVRSFQPNGDVSGVVVNIRQIHNRPDLERLSGQETAALAARVHQKFPILLQRMGVRELYVDGWDPEAATTYNDNFEMIRELKATYGFKGPGDLRSFSSQVRFRNGLDSAKVAYALLGIAKIWEQMEEQIRYKGHIRAAYEQGITLEGGEDPELYRQAISLAEADPCGAGHYPKMLDLAEERDEHIVGVLGEKSSASGQQRHFVTFGMLHDLQPEIGQWNAKHPNNKLAYIEITPGDLPDKVEDLPKSTGECKDGGLAKRKE